MEEQDAAEAADQQAGLPALNVKVETDAGALKGSKFLRVLRVEREDDGSYTAVVGE